MSAQTFHEKSGDIRAVHLILAIENLAYSPDVPAFRAVFSTRDFHAVPEKYRALIPEYVKEFVCLNQFAALGDR